MAVTLRTVILPDGRKAIEYETEHIGGSETQVTYEYKTPWLKRAINVWPFKRDYWGRVEGLTFLD